jgi:hypothetical protein
MSDSDKVFAYGLEPQDNEEAEPHLIFMGTTYPAGQGFVTQVCSDMANDTPGALLYRHSREKIGEWLDKQQKKTHVCGMSLGGALSLLLALDQGEKLSRVDALNPPGLYEPWIKNSLDRWDEIKDKPLVYVQKQGNDPVSRFGIWKKDWLVYHVQPSAEYKGSNDLMDHALNYAGLPSTTFTPIDVENDNQERQHRNFWLYTIARSIIYWLFMMPFRYVILPILRSISDYKIALASAPAVGAVLTFIPTIPPIATALVGAAFILVATSYLLYKIIKGVEIVLDLHEDFNQPENINNPAKSV